MEQHSSLQLDSQFSLIEKTLNQSGFTRNHSETLKNWIERLSNDLPKDEIKALQAIVQLHYRDCFDPQGITASERIRLKYAIQSWLFKYKTNAAKNWHHN
jgi:hypothetical protein